MSPYPTKLVFLHMPRSGGTTLRHMLSAAIPPEQICPERFMRLRLWPTEELDRFRLFSGHFTFPGIERIPGEKRVVTVLREPKARIISTWQMWARHTEEYLAENPAPHLRMARESADLGQFLGLPDPAVCDAVANLMARYLAGHFTARPDGRIFEETRVVSDAEVLERAERNLRRCEVIGVTDDLGGFYARLAAAWGLPPAEALPHLNGHDEQRREWDAPREPVLSDEALAWIDAHTRLDRQIYALARQLAGQAPA